MKLNYRPERVAFIDFETQSEAELTTTHKYASDPSTRVLTCVVRVGGKELRMGPYLRHEDEQLLAAIAETHVLVAHNAVFDAAIWELSAKLPEATWFDTLPCCRAAGLPGALDSVGTVLTGEGKDKNGKRLIDMLCKVKRGKVPAIGPAHMMLLDYNARDVQLLEQVYEKVKSFGEPDVMQVDYTINQRGVPIDREFLTKLIDLYHFNEQKEAENFSKQTDGVNPGSSKQVREWLLARGFDVPSVNKSELAAFANRPEDYFIGDTEMDDAVAVVEAALAARREVVRVGKGKAHAALKVLEHDDRAREQTVYWGAHTGRWTGRSMQLHNMPTMILVQDIDVRCTPLEYDAVAEVARAATEKRGTKVYVTDVLNAMLRHMVRSDNLLVADYASVEARCVAWMAREERMLALYSDPEKSIYIDMGSQVFGRQITKKGDTGEYAIAKSLVLGCGYGMSGAKFEMTCILRDVDLSPLARTGLKVPDLVRMYRTTYPGVKKLWDDMHSALHLAVGGCPSECGRSKLYMVGPDFHVELPSGRHLVYRNARIEMRVPAYVKLYNMPEQVVPTVIFDHPRGYQGFLYGSKLVENIAQAICRDFMADALVKAEQAGLKPVLHVHDELVCDAEDKHMETLLDIMSTGPGWIDGFPLVVEGYSGPIWTKQTKGYRELSAMNGRLL